MASPAASSPSDCGSSKTEEEAPSSEHRSITETVINGSMKETVSLTVDAKTETAVFKRFENHLHTKELCFRLMVMRVGPVPVGILWL